MAKKTFISFRVDPGIKEKAEIAARQRGMNVSQFMSFLLVKALAADDRARSQRPEGGAEA